MKKYTVTRKFNFVYGHRLLNYKGKCAHLHGHNGVAEITFSSSKLDDRGMVLDFVDLKSSIQAWLDKELDHKMLLKENDPFVILLKEHGEPVYVMKSNPTAENIAQLIFEKALSLGLPVTEVKLWETPTEVATYSL